MSEAVCFSPATPDRWDDIEDLFGRQGACGGCWCMFWRLRRSEFTEQAGETNRDALREIVLSGSVPGLLAYSGGEPVGWCSVGPREDFPVLDRSPVLKRVDDKPVWSIVCLYVRKDFRRRGLAASLVEAAVGYARSKGATIVEAYPSVPKGAKVEDVSLFTGPMGVYAGLGFVEVARRSQAKAIMRYVVRS